MTFVFAMTESFVKGAWTGQVISRPDGHDWSGPGYVPSLLDHVSQPEVNSARICGSPEMMEQTRDAGADGFAGG